MSLLAVSYCAHLSSDQLPISKLPARLQRDAMWIVDLIDCIHFTSSALGNGPRFDAVSTGDDEVRFKRAQLVEVRERSSPWLCEKPTVYKVNRMYFAQFTRDSDQIAMGSKKGNRLRAHVVS